MENEVNTTHPFTESGFTDIEKATEMFSALKIDNQNLRTVDTVKLREVAEFVESFEDGLNASLGVLRRRINGDISPLDHLHGYIRLQKQKMALQGQIEALNKELSFYQ